jgi:hypothetical protein
VQRHLDQRGWLPADLSRATRGQGRIDESVIGRWKNHSTRPEIESVRIVAKVFGRDVREAMIRAGYATAKELNAAWPDLSDADLAARLSDDALIEEIRARLHSPKPSADSPPSRQPAAAASENGSNNGNNGSNGSVSTPVAAGPHSTEVAPHGYEEAPPPQKEGEGADDGDAALRDWASN